MWSSILALVIFLSVFFLVADVRAQQLRRKSIKIPDETISSVFSRSMAELVGVAGGIYLSLTMLISFLKINIPEMIVILGIEVEPLAFVSIILALCQPFILEIYERIY